MSKEAAKRERQRRRRNLARRYVLSLTGYRRSVPVGDDGLTWAERKLFALRWLAAEGSPTLAPCECAVCKSLRADDEEVWA